VIIQIHPVIGNILNFFNLVTRYLLVSNNR